MDHLNCCMIYLYLHDIICLALLIVSVNGSNVNGYYKYPAQNLNKGGITAITHSSGMSVSQCKALCDNTANCLGAITSSNNDCWVKSAEAEISTIVAWTTPYLYTDTYSRKDQTGYSFTANTICDSTSYYSSSLNRYVKDCSISCSQQANCIFFVFDQDETDGITCRLANKCDNQQYLSENNLYQKIGTWCDWNYWEYTGQANVHERQRIWQPGIYGFTNDMEGKECFTRQFTNNMLSKNKKLSSTYMFHSELSRSKLSCLSLCQSDNRCKSVNIGPIDANGKWVCELHAVTSSNSLSALVDSTGYIHYELQVTSCEGL